MTYSDVEFVSEAACGEVARRAVTVARKGRDQMTIVPHAASGRNEYWITARSGERLWFGPARCDDAGILGAFYENLTSATRELYAPHEFSPAFAKRLCETLDSCGIVPMIATDENRSVVYAYFLLYTSLFDGEVERYHSYGIQLEHARDCMFAPVVADAWQSQGLAGLLMPVFFASARKLGFRRMILLGGTQRRNARAVRFYGRLGFTLVGYYGDDNFNQDMIISLDDTAD